MGRRLPIVLLVLLAAGFSACRKEGRFSHEGHVTVTKGRCGACHGEDPGAPRRASAADCAGCHKEARDVPPGRTSRYIPGLRDEAPSPLRGHAGIRFSHKSHEAEPSCAACHSAERFPGVRFPAMARCVECHAREDAPGDCVTCHRLDPRSCAACHDPSSCRACHPASP